MKLVFFNVGWMERYEGLTSGDEIRGGGSYVREKRRGHEVCNFAAVRGVVYGYVQPPGSQIDIERLGASPAADKITGVTIVWTATRPTGGTAVVGWYKNATVFRDYQRFERPSKQHRDNRIDGYWARTTENNATLLGVDERTCEIPRQVKGGMGQSNVWYADSPLSTKTVTQVCDFIGGARAKPSRSRNATREHDQERKSKIERTAVRLCCKHFEGLGYAVTSVEKDNVGWDLEAASGKTTLRIEVKGLSGPSVVVELTPNEYRALAEKSSSYRLAVVTRALSSPTLFICRYSFERDNWVVEGKGDLRVTVRPIQSAVVQCS